MPQFVSRSHSPHMHLLSSPLALPPSSLASHHSPIYRHSLSASPKREAVTPLMPLTHQPAEANSTSRNGSQAPASETKLPSIDQLLLTPPSSTEMPKEHSFPAYYDDHGASDHSLFPYQRRPPSQGSQDSNAPLFSPAPRLQLGRPPSLSTGSSEPGRRPSATLLPPLSDPVRRSSDPHLHKYITSHQTQFNSMHPGSSAPKEEHYQLFVDFLGDLRSRPPGSLPPQQPLQETSPNRPPVRALAPQQYAPYYPSSPAKRPSFTAQNAKEDSYPASVPERHETPPKRRRLSSEVSERLEPEASPQPPRRRRSAQAVRKRGGSGGGVLKETKHNRNRSTKEKKSTNFEDYHDYAPPFETMQKPMEAAAGVPEHKVNTRKDLSADPLREHLHETELKVAQRLNIGCSEYLVFKRQVFEVYVSYLKEAASSRGQWNKTRAQQAGNLDVGKASQIWVFWKNVGWFQEELFKEYL